MTLNNFKNNIELDDNLKLIAEKKQYFIIFNSILDKKFKVPFTTIENSDFENILAVLNGRDPFVIDGITRICGYMSKISNWNKSKLGELKARRKGNYSLRGGK
jgi:hypothetical protein